MSALTDAWQRRRDAQIKLENIGLMNRNGRSELELRDMDIAYDRAQLEYFKASREYNRLLKEEN